MRFILVLQGCVHCQSEMAEEQQMLSSMSQDYATQLMSIPMLGSGLSRTLLLNALGRNGPEAESREDILLPNEVKKLLWMGDMVAANSPASLHPSANFLCRGNQAMLPAERAVSGGKQAVRPSD